MLNENEFYFLINFVFSLTESGLTEGLSKVTNRTQPTSTIIESNEDERENLISKRESSHEYD